MDNENSSTVKHKPDAMCKDFYASDERFSDFVNGAFFDGEQVIDASMLSDYDTDVSTYNDEQSKNRYHDVVKCVNINGLKALIILENQSTYCAEMLYRIKEYDYNLFLKEYHRFLASNKTRKILNVMNLVLNYNSVPWYGPKSYEDMSECPPEVFRRFTWFDSFPIIDIISLDENKFQNKDNRDMIGGLKKLYQWKGNIKALEGMVVSKAVALVLAAMMGDLSLIHI